MVQQHFISKCSIKLQSLAKFVIGVKTALLLDMQEREPRNKPQSFCPLIFGKSAENTQWREDALFGKWCWRNWIFTCRSMQYLIFLTPHTNTDTTHSTLLGTSAINPLGENIPNFYIC